MQGWEIVHIVTHIGHMRKGQAQACTQGFERGELIVDAQEDVWDAQHPRALLHSRRGIATQQRHFNTSLLCEFDTLSVPDVEFFDFFPALGVVQTAIRESPRRRPGLTA